MARDQRCKSVNWNWEDFLFDAKVANMSPTCLGLWVRVLGRAAIAERPGILGTEDFVRRASEASDREWGQFREQLLSALSTGVDGFFHPRTVREHDEQTSRISETKEMKRQAGLRSAEARARARVPRSEPTTDPNACSTPATTPVEHNGQHEVNLLTPSLLPPDKQTLEDLSPSGDVKVRSPKREESKADREWREGFVVLFWADYSSLGRKCSKGEAFMAWMKIPHPDPQSAFDRLDAAFQPALAEWRTRDKQYVPHASKWLNSYRKDLLEESKNGHISVQKD